VLAQKTEELTATPKVEKIEEPRVEGTITSEILSPSAGVEVPKTQKGLAVTPKIKRVVNVLDVLETIKSSSSTRVKLPKLQKHKLRQQPLKPKLHSAKLRPKLGLQSPPRRNPWKPEKKKQKWQSRFWLKKLPLPSLKNFPKLSIIFYDMLRGKS
jgi:hypothetical protein